MNKQLTRGSQILFVFGFVFIIIMFTFSAAPTITRTSQDDVQHCDYVALKNWPNSAAGTLEDNWILLSTTASTRRETLHSDERAGWSIKANSGVCSKLFVVLQSFFRCVNNEMEVTSACDEHFEHCWDNNTCSQSTWEERHCAGFCSHWCRETTFP